VEAIPNDYSVQAFVNGSWIVLMNRSQTLSQTIDLDVPVFTDRIRLQIPSGGLYSLAEFGGYSVSSYITACSYIDRNLLPGEYQYHVVAVNRAGLQSRKSEPCLGVITEKDLSVHINEVYLYPKKPSILDQVTVQAIIRNNGEQNISNVKVKFFLDDDPNCFFETVIPEMEAKQDIFVRTSVDYLGEAGKHNLFVKVDPDNSITEYDETNNEALKSIEIVEQRSFVSHINSIDSTKFTEIKLNLAVLDEENQGFNGLSYDNFTLTEDGVEQTIKSIRCISDTQTTKPKMDIVFVIDITGSMDSVIEGVKNNCLTLLDLLDSQNIDYNLGLTVFGDYVYIQNNGDLISSATTFRDWIIKIPRPDWGGDGPENALGALRDSIDGMHYRVDAQKIFVVITDAPSPSYSATPPPIPTLAGVLQQVKEVYGIVYVVGPTVESVKRAYGTNCPTDWIEEYQGDNSLPTQTGGKFYEIGTDFSTLVYDLAYEIIRRKSNYEIIYDTSNINRDGSERLVKINMNYRTVSGEANGKYLAPADSLSDLAISNMNLNPAYPNDQDTCTVRLKVNNLGGAVVTNVPIRLYLGDPRNMGLTIEESIIPELAPGAETMIEFTRAAKSGNYQLTAWVDPDDQIPEMNESNNLAHISMTVPGYQLPDLIVADIHHIPDVVFRGDRINLTAKVANLGASSSQIKVVCYDNLPERGGKILGERTINQLSYLQMADLSFDINTYNLTGDTTVYVIVDPLNQIFESDETNNNGRKNIHIYPRLIMGSIVANKTEYISNETALFDVRIENNQEQSWTGAAEVVIKDENNNIIAVIGRYNSLELDIPASGNNFWATTVSWNTGRCKPGNYIAQLNILDETSQHNNIIAEFSTIFRIAPNKYVNGEITTDKILYAPGESVRITIQHTNQSLNTNLDNLTGKVEIINSLEQLLWSQEYTINSLPMGLTDIQTFIWTTGTNATNEYLIRVTLFENEQILWNGTKTFTISSNVKFTGSLEVAPNKAIAGQMVDLIYSLLNKGNQSCEGLQLQFHFVNTVTDQVMKTLTTIHDLPISQSVSNILKYTVDLPDAQYMVIMLTEKNEETYPLSSAALLVDSTPPVTVAELSDQRLDKDGVLYGVLNSKLTLTAADNLSGVAETLLDIGAGFQPYNEPVTFPAEGKYIVRYKSIDRLGNEENVKELMVVIDETPPVAAIISPIDNQEVAPEFLVNLSASDNVGLDYFELYINDQKYATYNISPLEQILQLEPGIYILKVRAVDLAGYESWSAPVNIKVQKADTTPPVTIAEYPTDWTNQDATVILNATDDLSGVKETRFRINDGPWQAGTILQIITEGNHAIEFYSIDNAGNGEIVKSITVRLDRTKPVTEIKLTGDQKPDGSYQSNVTVNITAIDNLNGSGINRIYYRIGVEGGYQPYTEPLVITTEGLNEVYAYAVDNAGNHEEPQRIEFKIVKGWESDYSLICNKLTIYGHLNVDRVFVNGQVNIYGHCNLNYLGTTEKTILKTGPSTIDQLRTEQPHQAIPAPDWEGLKTVTELRQEKQIPKDVSLNNVRFENSLMIAGTTKLSGLIVVKGDLTINGNVDLKDAGIFCSGKITFNGNVKGSGLIYATGLTAHGNPQLNGVIIVNGPVEASGSVGNNGVDLHKYLKWFK
jgi:cytoskeletal protein CcmA (bactofilin family)